VQENHSLFYLGMTDWPVNELLSTRCKAYILATDFKKMRRCEASIPVRVPQMSAPSGKRALQNQGSFRIPRSAERRLPPIMPNLPAHSERRPGTLPVEVCPAACASRGDKPETRGRQRFAWLSAAEKPSPARQSAACPEFPPISFLPPPFSSCAPE